MDYDSRDHVIVIGDKLSYLAKKKGPRDRQKPYAFGDHGGLFFPLRCIVVYDFGPTLSRCMQNNDYDQSHKQERN